MGCRGRRRSSAWARRGPRRHRGVPVVRGVRWSTARPSWSMAECRLHLTDHARKDPRWGPTRSSWRASTTTSSNRRLVRRPHSRAGRCRAPKIVRTTSVTTSGCSRATRCRTWASTWSPAGRRRSTASSRWRTTRCARVLDVHERVKDMNAGGVLASLASRRSRASPGRLFAAVDDKDLALAVVRAYNDWHIDEWVVPTPTASSRWRCPCSGTRSWPRTRSGGRPRRAATR